MMHQTLTIILLFSFTGIAVFGFFGAHFGEKSMSLGCLIDLAARAQGLNCQSDGTPIAIANFHLSILKSFVLGVFGDGIARALLFLAAAFLAVSIVGAEFKLPVFSPAIFPGTIKSEISRLQPKLLRWLAFHENSPAPHSRHA